VTLGGDPVEGRLTFDDNAATRSEDASRTPKGHFEGADFRFARV
jgi:hypothetical protein